MNEAPKSITIEEPHLLRQIRDEQRRRGDSTTTKTARFLLVERLAALERDREREHMHAPDNGAGIVSDRQASESPS